MTAVDRDAQPAQVAVDRPDRSGDVALEPRRRSVDDGRLPAPVGRSQRRARSCRTSSISSSSSSGSLKPSRLKNLMPLYSAGLCEAEITTPPSASSSRVSSATAGVGTMPREQRVGAAGADARDERRLEHVAAAARVPADDDAAARRGRRGSGRRPRRAGTRARASARRSRRRARRRCRTAASCTSSPERDGPAAVRRAPTVRLQALRGS